MKDILIKTAIFVYRHYKSILVSAVILSVIFISLILRIEIKSDMMDVMPADNPSMKQFSDILNDFQSMNSLTVVIDSGSNDIDQHTELLQALAGRISESALIKDVDYSVFQMPWEFLFRNFPLYMDEEGFALLRQKLSTEGIQKQVKENYRTLASFISSPADAKIISEDPLDIRSLFSTSSMRRKSTGMDVSSGYYFSKDHTKAFIFVTPNGSGRDFSFMHNLKKEMERISSQTKASYNKSKNLVVGFTGSYAISWEAQDSIRGDMLTSVLITVFLVLLIFRFVYRGRLPDILVIFLTIAMSLIITLTSAFLLYGGLNLVTALVSAMLIGLGFDYALHIYDRYMLEFKACESCSEALEITFANTGRSIVTSSITTAFAFFSIVITSFTGLHELGIIAGIGIIACMLSSLIIMGAILTWLSKSSFSRLHAHGENKMLERTLPDYIFKYGKVLLTVICVIVIILSAGISKLSFTSDISQIGLKKSRALELQNSMFELTGSKGIPLIVAYQGNDFHTSFSAMEERLINWAGNNLIKNYMSLSSIIPSPSRQESAINGLKGIYSARNSIERDFVSALELNNFNVDEKSITYIRNLVVALQINSQIAIDGLPGDLRTKADMFYNKEKGRVAAYIYPPDGKWNKETISALQEDLSGKGPRWQLTGWQLLQNDLEKSIIRESLTAGLLSFVFILFVLYLHFRKPVVILLVQLPLLAGMILTLGIMGALNIKFNYINISAITIIFGISVDYGVYFMQSFLEAGKEDKSGLVRHAFRNIVICSFTTIAGFGSLIFTSFRGISSLGQVIIIGIISCLIMSAALIPVSDRLLKR